MMTKDIPKKCRLSKLRREFIRNLKVMIQTDPAFILSAILATPQVVRLLRYQWRILLNDKTRMSEINIMYNEDKNEGKRRSKVRKNGDKKNKARQNMNDVIMEIESESDVEK